MPLAATAALAVACGPASGAVPSATSTPVPGQSSTPTTKGPFLAALEPGGFGQVATAHTAIDILSADGRLAARVNFSPRSVPRIGNAAPVLAPEAVVAAGRVWFADGSGQVRWLRPSGQVQEVTRFPLLNPQQQLSFAVSPDGSRLEATVFSWPPVHSPPPRSPIDPAFGPGSFLLDLYTAVPGQGPSLLRHLSWPQPQQPRNVLEVVDWSALAPLATVDSVLGTQQPLPGRFFGHLAELDASGHPGSIVGGPTCYAVSVTADETVLCLDAYFDNPAVRTRDGSLIFQVPAKPGQAFGGAALSPDGQRVALGNTVLGRDGSRVQLPPQFAPEGWLDGSTVVGVQLTNQGESGLELVRLASPGRVQDLGVRAHFVGAIQT